MFSRIPRRQFLKVTSAAIATSAAAPLFGGQNGPATPRTFTYKKVGDLEIQADVYRPDVPADTIVPVVIWIHGGALIVGNRKGVDRRLLERLLPAGYAVVSIDYRKAPETKAPEILADVADGCRWVREKGPELFKVDTRRIGVAGGSAGGYLTLTTGFRVEPRPAALVAFWGYGELASAWYAQPSEHYRKQPLVAREEALAAVGKEPLTDGSKPGAQRGKFYLYCRQNGLWPKEVAGLDPQSHYEDFAPFCPLRNVTKDYPPTLLVHGTDDTDVPYEQSSLMDAELTRHGVEHKLVTVENAGHGLSGADPARIAAAYDEAAAFLQRYVPNRSK